MSDRNEPSLLIQAVFQILRQNSICNSLREPSEEEMQPNGWTAREVETFIQIGKYLSDDGLYTKEEQKFLAKKYEDEICPQCKGRLEADIFFAMKRLSKEGYLITVQKYDLTQDNARFKFNEDFNDQMNYRENL